MKKILGIILITAFLINTFAVNSFATDNEITEEQLTELFMETVVQEDILVQADEAEIEEIDKAPPCNATLDMDFRENCVLVVMNREQSRQKTEFTSEDFPGIDIDSIEILMGYNEKTDNRQILQITLNNSTKQKVLDSIKILECFETVYSAEPDYIVELIKPENTIETITENTAQVMHIARAYTPNQCLKAESDANIYSGICCAKNYTLPNKNNVVKIGIVGNGVDPTSEGGQKYKL